MKIIYYISIYLIPSFLFLFVEKKDETSLKDREQILKAQEHEDDSENDNSYDSEDLSLD